MEMSHISLNYDDVRGLVSWLGKHRPHPRDPRDCQTFISAALNTSSGLFIARLRFGEPIEQIGIQLTLDHVTKLSHAMITQDLTALRHTDRLEVVAGCLGWRADALMHHLKTTTGKLGRNPSLEYEANLVENFSRLAGPRRIERWTSILSGGPGLYVVTGKPGNGVVHSYTASFLLAGAGAIVDQEGGLIVGRSKDGQRVYGMAIRNGEDLRACAEIATHSAVVVSLSSRGLDDAIGKLRDVLGGDMSVVKGILYQTLRHEADGWESTMEIIDQADLTAPAASSSVLRFPHDMRSPDLLWHLLEFATSRRAADIHVDTDGLSGVMRLRADLEKSHISDSPRYKMHRFADNVPHSVISALCEKVIELSDRDAPEGFLRHRRIKLSEIRDAAVRDQLRAVYYQDNQLSNGRYLVIRFLYTDNVAET
jgi:hypothetical protein